MIRKDDKMHYRIENDIIETDSVNFDFAKLGGVGNVMFQNMKKHGAKPAQVSAQILIQFSVIFTTIVTCPELYHLNFSEKKCFLLMHHFKF